MDPEGTYPIVLGYDWLAENNPLINWKERSVKFRSTKQPEPELLPETTPTMHTHSQDVPNHVPSISLISAAAYFQASKEKSVFTY